MKKKSLSLLLSGLLTVCLTGVGFASWIIVQGDTEEVETGEVVVEQVTEKNITIETSWKNSQNTFNFTGISGANSGWLRSDTETPERLSLTLVVTIKNAEYDADGKVAISFTASNPTNYTDVTTTDKRTTQDETQTYLIAPTITDHTIDTESANFTAAVGETPSSYTFELPITFQWGQFFGGQNPYTYYQGKDYASNVEEAKNALGDLYSKMDGMTFTVELVTA